jgi:hypothetical protein
MRCATGFNSSATVSQPRPAPAAATPPVPENTSSNRGDVPSLRPAAALRSWDESKARKADESCNSAKRTAASERGFGRTAHQRCRGCPSRRSRSMSSPRSRMTSAQSFIAHSSLDLRGPRCPARFGGSPIAPPSANFTRHKPGARIGVAGRALSAFTIELQAPRGRRAPPGARRHGRCDGAPSPRGRRRRTRSALRAG